MVVVALSIQVFLYHRCKFFNGNGIWSGCFFAYVTGCCFTHIPHINQHIYKIILNKVKIAADFFPRGTKRFFKSLFKFLVSSNFCQVPFHICQCRYCTIKSLHFVKHFQEYRENGFFVLFSIHLTFRVNIKKSYIRRNSSCQPHICQHHTVFDFFIFLKIFQSSLSIDCFIFQKIRQNFQEVGFTTSKEAGNPHAHFICCSGNPTLITIKKITKMFL